MNKHSASGSGPLAAVAAPACNAARTLRSALHSARGRSDGHPEIIRVDDGSTDATAGIVAAHGRGDPRVPLIPQDRQGVAAARNRGTAEARADFVATLDADDLWRPGKIERQVQALSDAGDACGLAGTFPVAIDPSDRIIDPDAAGGRTCQGFVLLDLLLGNFVGSNSSPLPRRSALVEAGGYDPDLSRARGRRLRGPEALPCARGAPHVRGRAAAPGTGWRIISTSMSSDVARMIRPHRLVTEPCRRSHPDQVRLGQVDPALLRPARRGKRRDVAPEPARGREGRPWRVGEGHRPDAPSARPCRPRGVGPRAGGRARRGGCRSQPPAPRLRRCRRPRPAKAGS